MPTWESSNSKWYAYRKLLICVQYAQGTLFSLVSLCLDLNMIKLIHSLDNDSQNFVEKPRFSKHF